MTKNFFFASDNFFLMKEKIVIKILFHKIGGFTTFGRTPFSRETFGRQIFGRHTFGRQTFGRRIFRRQTLSRPNVCHLVVCQFFDEEISFYACRPNVCRSNCFRPKDGEPQNVTSSHLFIFPFLNRDQKCPTWRLKLDRDRDR